MEAARLFPGIYFETVTPASRHVLPRMDIAAFVGFATSGPLHTPVAVEEASQFRSIFGEDVPLAWDPDKGRMVHSYLGSAVEAFFQNGGRRCWVVRVADETSAHTFDYPLPGVVGVTESSIAAAQLRARSPGSWARQYRISTVLKISQLRVLSGSVDVNARGWSMSVRTPPVQIEIGDLLRVGVDDTSVELFLFVAHVSVGARATRLSGDVGYIRHDPRNFSPPMDGPAPMQWQDWHIFPLSDVELLGLGGGWPLASPVDAHPRVQRLRFNLQAWKSGVLKNQVEDATFHPCHPRFFGGLPSDRSLYANTDGHNVSISRPEQTQFVKQANQSGRFPFCGAQKNARMRHFLPLGMGLAMDDALSAAPNHASAPSDALTQDGLQQFNSALFLDKHFTWADSTSLAGAIEERRWTDDIAQLRGIHSLFTVQEATLVAVPDAVHRRWDNIAPDMPAPLPAPRLESVASLEMTGAYNLCWSPVENATSYIVEQDRTATFSSPRRYIVRGRDAAVVGRPAELMPAPETSLAVQVAETCDDVFFFRVRAQRLGQVSLWSNTRAKTIPDSVFLHCDAAPAELWDLELEAGPSASPPGKIDMTWHAMDGAADALAQADGFEIQQAGDTEFASAKIIYSGKDRSVSIDEKPDAVYFYRVRAVGAASAGPWSNAVRLAPTRLSRMTLQPLSQEDTQIDILDIHRSLVRLCHARGDLVAIVALPHHFRKDQVMAYLAAFHPKSSASMESGAGVPALTLGETAAMEYAALYYPWLAIRPTAGDVDQTTGRYFPPDGPVAGLMARHTLRFGAWYAPACEPLEDVVAIDPPAGDNDLGQMLQSNVNLILGKPEGFMPMSQQTLAYSTHVEGIHVRRLLILLRRLVLREGNTYVFEPNDNDFRDRVQHQFENLLNDLYLRGAFAGSTAESAYRVTTDDSVNTPRRIDLGRFIVEIDVAPSQPLKFLKIRLTQTGPQRLQVQEY